MHAHQSAELDNLPFQCIQAICHGSFVKTCSTAAGRPLHGISVLDQDALLVVSSDQGHGPDGHKLACFARMCNGTALSQLRIRCTAECCNQKTVQSQ